MADIRIEVTLDGIEQQDVVSFNTREGWVKTYSRDHEGNFITQRDEFVLKMHEGIVHARGRVE